MASPRRLAEMEFELALTSALEDAHGVHVRVDGDVLNRRRNGYATLGFTYKYPRAKSLRAEARVSIAGAAEEFRFDVDLADRDSIDEAVADCEELALAVFTRLEQDKPLTLAEGGLRWDD